MTTYDVLAQAFYDELTEEATPLEVIASGLETLTFFWETIPVQFGTFRFFIVAHLDGGLILTSAPTDWLVVLALPSGWCPPQIIKECSEYTVVWETLLPGMLYDLEVSISGGGYGFILEKSEATQGTFDAFPYTVPTPITFRLRAWLGEVLVVEIILGPLNVQRDVSISCVPIRCPCSVEIVWFPTGIPADLEWLLQPPVETAWNVDEKPPTSWEVCT